MVIKIINSIFIAIFLFSFQAFSVDTIKIVAVVDSDTITNIDVDNMASIICLSEKNKEGGLRCFEKSKMPAMQLLVNTKIQKSYFEKIESKLQNIDFNGKDFKAFLSQNEAQFGFSRKIAQEKKLDYDLFFEYVKNQFLFLMLVHSYDNSEKGEKNNENSNIKKAEQLMQKIRSQIFLEFRVDSL